MFLIPGFGDRLANKRKRLGYTQEALASLLNVRPITVHQYEKEKSTPQLKMLWKLQKIGVDIQYLLSGVHTPQHDKQKEKLPQESVTWIASIVDTIEKDIAPKSLPTDSEINLIITLIEFLSNIPSATTSGTRESLLVRLAIMNNKDH